MSTKFEQLLDYLVNEEMDKANELFHEIVVEKSRDIYENLIAEEAEDEEEMDEASEEAEDEEELDEETTLEIGGDDEGGLSADDAADSLALDTQADDEEGGEFGGDDFGGEEGGDEDLEDKVMDLEDALEELKAEFDALMADEQNEPEHNDGVDDPDFGSDDEGEEDSEEEGEEEGDDEEEMDEDRMMTREYVEKVGNDWQGNSQKAQGKYVGAGTGEKQSPPVEGKSPVSSGKGKPTTGATAHNILGSKSTGEGTNTGTTPNGKTGGLTKNPQQMKTGNQNVPGGKVSVKGLTKVAQNSKTPGPVGSGTGDKAGQTSVGNVKSPINGAPNRNA